MTDRHAPYRFAARVLGFLLAMGALLAAADGLSPHLPPTWLAALANGPGDRALLHGSDGKVLYLGGSVLDSVNPSETNQLPLHAMVAIRVPEPVVAVAGPANALDTFHAQLAFLVRSGIEPRLTIVPINLRSFSPLWEFNPHHNFELENRMYAAPFLTRALAVFKWPFSRPEHDDTLAAPVFIDGERRGNVGDFVRTTAPRQWDDEWIGRRYRIHYCADVERSRRFQDLKALLALVERENLPVLFYLTPIDHQAMARFTTPEDRAVVDRNLARLRSVLAGARVPWLDLAYSLRARQFDHPRWGPNEHLNASGRTPTAAAIAREVRRLLAADPAGPQG